MVFSSLIFLYLFLPVLLFFLAIVRKEYRNLLLLIASIIFYSWGGVSYTLILVISVIFNYLTGIKIGNTTKVKPWLVIGIVVNLSLLIIFKYANFLVDNVNILTSFFGVNPIILKKIVLPVGISFYTFQSISYLVDIYKKDVVPQRNFVNLALYISFFPQLIAGPIIKYNEIYRQIEKRNISVQKFYEGIKRFSFGLAKKVLISNQIAFVTDNIFALESHELSMPIAWLGALCYALQIYFDFSGYSDMAIGLGKMFGFRFPENFNMPYISLSIKEFWRRWHITLSSWFRTYLYIPLGGNRKGKYRTYINLYIVFLLTGLWHGASWNFIVWGLIHGTFIVLERFGWDKILARTFKPIQHLYVLLIATIAWVYFRADTITQANDIVRIMFDFTNTQSPINIAKWISFDFIVAFCIGVIGCTNIPMLIYRHTTNRINKGNSFLLHSYNIVVLAFVVIVLFFTTMYLVSGSYNPFIYYRF